MLELIDNWLELQLNTLYVYWILIFQSDLTDIDGETSRYYNPG